MKQSDGILFANGRFTFHADRLICSDCYPGAWRSTDGNTLTKDGAPACTWSGARLDRLSLRTPYPILDAAFHLAVDEALRLVAPAGTESAQLGADRPGGAYYHPYYYWTGGKDIREYTRDSAQHIQWGDSVIIARDAAKGTLLRRCDFAEKRIREDAVVTADNVHFIPAAWEYFKITGDKDFLAQTWDCMWTEMTLKEAWRRGANGLWTGAPWSDADQGFFAPEHFEYRNTRVTSLYANVVAAGAWRALADIAGALGHIDQAGVAVKKYLALKAAINTVLYRPEIGSYAYYTFDGDASCGDCREDISAGMLYLFGVADAHRTLVYHNRFTPTPYGYRNLDPIMPAGESAYHGGNVWENQEAFHGWMLAKLNRPDELANFIFWHARAGLILSEWREGTLNPTTGELHVNYKHLVWGAMGYTSYWTRGVFGILYDTGGLRFDPCVPTVFGAGFHAVLKNFTYRNSDLTIRLAGMGTTLADVTLDGRSVSAVPPDLTGKHEVGVWMANEAGV